MAELKYTNEKGAQDKYGDIQPSQTADRMAIIAPNLDLPEEDIEKGDDVVIGMSPFLSAILPVPQYDGCSNTSDTQLHNVCDEH